MARPAPTAKPAGLVQAMERPKRGTKRVIYDEEEIFASLDKQIEVQEEEDSVRYTKGLEEAQQAYEKLQASRKKRKVGDQGKSQSILYVKGSEKDPEVEEVTAFPVDKTRVRDHYEDAQLGKLQQQYYFVPSSSGEQFFSLQRGNDFVFYSLKPVELEEEEEQEKKPKKRSSKKKAKSNAKKFGYRREGNTGPAYAEVADTADLAAQWVLENIEGYDTIQDARVRVGSDINRMAGRREPRIDYPGKYLWGRAGLKSFAFIIRADKSRAPKATGYIEGVLKSRSTTFEVRFGGEDPLYVGTGSGLGRGPSGLRAQEEEGGSLSEYSEEEEEK